MTRLIVLRPGSTDFDEQGRITGRLDLPLNEQGRQQAAAAAQELAALGVDEVYYAPGAATLESAELVARACSSKTRRLDRLTNLDQGLWHGKLIAEVQKHQPRVFKQWQEHPESMCPPGGETLDHCRERIESALVKLLKKHRAGVVVLVAPEPLASVARSLLDGRELGDLWKAECESATWDIVDIEPALTGRH